MRNFKYSTIGLCLLTLMACNSNTNEQNSSSQIAQTPDDPALVTVNGQVITQKDLDIATLRLVGAARMAQLDAAASKKILESLVMSRVISSAAEAELSDNQKDRIARQVRDYREEILVKQYLRDHVEAAPITQAMVTAHYEKFPERYGAEIIHEFQLISASSKPEGTARQNMLKALTQVKDSKNWAAFVTKIKAQGVVVFLKQGRSNEKLLHKQLQLTLASLKVNETSRPFLIDGVPHVVRITKEITEQPRPLNEVSAQIRKALLPGQLKIAVKQVADKLQKTATIKYNNNKSGS